MTYRATWPFRLTILGCMGVGLAAASLAAVAMTGDLDRRPRPRVESEVLPDGQSPAGVTDVTPGRLTMALTGDTIITRRLSVHREPRFLELIELIRGADLAFTNLEMLFHDYESHPATDSGGIHFRADPVLARELAWAGFDALARANNHAGDYGVAGMRSTTRHVAEAGLVQAGIGESLAEAREARFLETADGRVAMVSVASTFPASSRAGRSRDDVPARPGLNPLRFSTTYVITRERFEALGATLRDLGGPVPAGDTLRAFGRRFVVGDRPGVRTVPHAGDLEEIAAVVTNASRLADHTVVTIHAHEGAQDRFVPADFLVTFARAMVDAGADIFVGHGPHVLRGIELYRGTPILYSLGDFVFENETIQRLAFDDYARLGLGPDTHVADLNDRRYDFGRRSFPADPEIWESVVAVPSWRGSSL